MNTKNQCLPRIRLMAILWMNYLACVCLPLQSSAESGYRLWLRYDLLQNKATLHAYRNQIQAWSIQADHPTLQVAKKELTSAITGLLGVDAATFDTEVTTKRSGLLVCGTIQSPEVLQTGIKIPDALNDDGFYITRFNHGGREGIVITSHREIGVLYGVFHFIRLIQTTQSLEKINLISNPKIQHRTLNHWDNLDRTVERGYTGLSIWDWHKLPEYVDKRYIDYARANASIGINGTVLTNVNANALILTPHYLEKVRVLADVFRPYGIKVFLTARFSAPEEIGGLATSDPLHEEVQAWWSSKVDEIYQKIPDFGGFLVKANSEGQPGPHNYGRSHAEGANMLAAALSPHGGMVMWRAFVYDENEPDDRARQAYDEFQPLDGQFHKNVMIQVKNGAIDFQPREPFHPLFGKMPQTPLKMEFQLTQEYLGFSSHLVYLPTFYKEVLDADTYVQGSGSKVSQVLDGSLHKQRFTGIAGVSNIGNDINWCGHPFAQANWYGYGRLAWDHSLDPADIAEEWLKMTFTTEQNFVNDLLPVMLQSHETTVNYMTPLGLHHIMGWDHHYGPAPWIANKHRADWTSVYYHRADSMGIGFDRSKSGSNAVGQYAPKLAEMWNAKATTPEVYLLWFHRVAWDDQMSSGRTLWEELCYRYYAGAAQVNGFREIWAKQSGRIDEDRFHQVRMLLEIQHREAEWWRNACVLYFQTFSNRPIPADLPPPDRPLTYYMQLEFPNAPGIKPKW